MLLAFVVAAIDWVAVHWFITLPIAVALTVLVIVLARRAHGRRLAAAVQAQADLAAAEARMREAVAALKPALGADYEDFMRAAQFVVSTRTTGRARLQAALGVSASRATQLQLMLENQEVISAPRGSHRDVLIPAHSAHYFELSRDTSPASA